ncbi:MAG: glutamyl-tRNA reductase, partial [bacterium]
MPLTVVGLSHSTGAPVEMRERLAFTSSGALQRALAYFKDALRNEAECVLISTCN